MMSMIAPASGRRTAGEPPALPKAGEPGSPSPANLPPPVKSQKLACSAMLVLFLALGGASGWFVYRRAPWGTAAVIGGVVGAILLYLPLGFLMAIPGRIGEWWLILRARLGAE